MEMKCLGKDRQLRGGENLSSKRRNPPDEKESS
jgi:hypothetical protein